MDGEDRLLRDQVLFNQRRYRQNQEAKPQKHAGGVDYPQGVEKGDGDHLLGLQLAELVKSIQTGVGAVGDGADGVGGQVGVFLVLAVEYLTQVGLVQICFYREVVC